MIDPKVFNRTPEEKLADEEAINRKIIEEEEKLGRELWVHEVFAVIQEHLYGPDYVTAKTIGASMVDLLANCAKKKVEVIHHEPKKRVFGNGRLLLRD